MELIEAKVSGLGIDPISNHPVVFLKEIQGDRFLPIWIGIQEAAAIAITIENKKTERPMTHDLIKTLLDGLDVKVNRIVVTDVSQNTFYARIYLNRDSSTIEIDARPSDSIAIALRTQAPIYISKSVFEKGSTFSIDKEEALKKHLETLKPEDFGKYKLK